MAGFRTKIQHQQKKVAKDKKLKNSFSRKRQSHSCPYENCDKIFNTASALRVHERRHTGERPYSCENCRKKFTQICNLKKHMLIHSGERSYDCTWRGCHKKFNQKIHLTEHTQIFHTKALTYSCQLCSKKFVNSYRLKRHMVSHNEIRSIVCEWSGCDKKFVREKNLKNHMLIHTGEKKFVCDICNSKFLRKFELKKHTDRNSCWKKVTTAAVVKTENSINVPPDFFDINYIKLEKVEVASDDEFAVYNIQQEQEFSDNQCQLQIQPNYKQCWVQLQRLGQSKRYSFDGFDVEIKVNNATIEPKEEPQD